MNNTHHRALAMVLVSVSVLWTKLFAVVAAVPLMATRVVLGAKVYWGLNFTVVGALIGLNHIEWGTAYMVLAVLLGSFSEFQSRGDTIQSAGVSAILVTLIVGAGVFGVFYYFHGQEMMLALQATFNDAFAQTNVLVSQAMGTDPMDEKTLGLIKAQFPSIILSLLIAALFLGLLGQNKLLKYAGMGSLVGRYRMEDFRLHDIFVWMFIGSLLGSFWQHDLEMVRTISINTLNVTVFLLFLQGLAVMSKFFTVFRVSTFWRVLWTALLIIQLSVGIVLLGLMDYWLDFRLRFVKQAKKIKEAQRNQSGRQ